MKTDRTEIQGYAKMGVAAMLPGMVHMLELMQAEVARFRALLSEAQEAAAQPGKSLSVYRQKKERASKWGARSGWPADPEERNAEAKRRRAVAKANKKKSALSLERKAAWDALPAKVKKQRVAAMLAGRLKRAKPKLEAAA